MLVIAFPVDPRKCFLPLANKKTIRQQCRCATSAHHSLSHRIGPRDRGASALEINVSQPCHSCAQLLGVAQALLPAATKGSSFKMVPNFLPSCFPFFFFGSGHRSSKRYRSFGRGMLRSRCKGRHCEAVRKQKLSGLARGYGCRACFPNSPSAAVVLLEKYFCDNFEFPTCPERSVSKERKRRQKHTHKHSHKMGSVERPILMIRFICRKCCTNKFRLIPGLERTLPTIRGHSLGPGAAVCKAARAFVSP